MGVASSGHAPPISTSNTHTLIGNHLKTFHLKPNPLQRLVCWADFHPPPAQPPPALALYCNLYNGLRYQSDVPLGGLYSAPCDQMLGWCWYSISVCHALTPTARSTTKAWNRTSKLNCVTISCNKWSLYAHWISTLHLQFLLFCWKIPSDLMYPQVYTTHKNETWTYTLNKTHVLLWS